MQKEFHLTVTEFHGPEHWSWRLTGSDGDVLGDNVVRLDPHGEEYNGFTDLEARLAMRIAPDARREQEDALAQSIGSWITTAVLGDLAHRLVAAAPCTVMLNTGEHAAALAYRPWELAMVASRTLADHGVTFVVEGPSQPLAADACATPLRMLAIFSQPSGMEALSLREDRRELELLTQRSTGFELRFVQYGATRHALAQAAADPGGWDIIHLAGHGTQESFVLEDSSGGPDRATASELVELLVPACHRTRLVTISSCRSAAQILAETVAGATESSRGPGVASSLAQNLRCAVLAMRFPVSDDFARALAHRLYELVIVDGARMDEALDAARRHAHRDTQASTLAWATPTLFGLPAFDLVWMPPPAQTQESPRTRTVPAPPQRFLGRVATMTRCGQVLTADSASPTVVLHGMPGIGKSALAAELAHVHRHEFEHVIWFGVPVASADTEAVLADLVVTIEAAVPDAELVHLIDLHDGLSPDLDSLPAAFGAARVLLVLDNVEPLLAADGSWRDARWHRLTEALSRHDGRSRLIITSRQVPHDVAGAVVETVHALSPDEAALLAHKLPNLRDLLAGRVPGLTAVESRGLARKVLDVARGHPKLLELAAGQAADLALIRQLIAHEPSPGHNYADVLHGWTIRVIDTLGAPSRKLFDLLCWLTEEDRREPVLSALWESLTQSRAQPPMPVLDAALAELTSAALVQLDGPDRTCRLHPAIVQAGRAVAGDARMAVAAVAAAYWRSKIETGISAEQEGGPVLPVMRDARSAVPYLLDLGEVKVASDALDLVLRRERSRLALAALLPTAARLVRAAERTPVELGARRLVANILAMTGSPAAERLTSQLRDRALASGDTRLALSLTGDLIGRYRESGRLADALSLAQQQIDLGHEVGVGPWTGLLHENQRLNIMATSGQAVAALPEIEQMRRAMAVLPTVAGDEETVRPFWVRELVLDTALTAALATEDWAGALDAAEEAMTLKTARGASEPDIAAAVFRTCGPLMRLQRLKEAEERLLWCRREFTADADVLALATTFSTLAEIEQKRGHMNAAVQLSRDALRYHYAARTHGGVLSGHLNIGNRMARTGAMRTALAHHIAAALLGLASRHYHYDRALGTLAFDLIALPDLDVWPSSVDEVCTLVNDVPGVDLAQMLRSLPDPGRTEAELLEEIFVEGRRRSEAVLRPNLAFWDPALSALAAAKRDTAAAAAMTEYLHEVGNDPSWRALSDALLELHQPPEVPTMPELDEIDGAIYRRATAMLRGEVDLPKQLWTALPIAEVLGNVVGATYGRKDRLNAAHEQLANLREEGDQRLCERLESIVDGERDLGALLSGLDDIGRDVIRGVVPHVRPQ